MKITQEIDVQEVRLGRTVTLELTEEEAEALATALMSGIEWDKWPGAGETLNALYRALEQ